ncbi:MAG: GatB/YqeY domain-containing protein [Solirubrobacteraceae bacterium]
MRGDLIAAMKARDDLAVVALRSAIAAIDDAEAIDVDRTASRDANSEHIAGASAGVGSTEAPRRVLSDADEHAVVRAQAEERFHAAQEYEKLGRGDVAERLRREADLLLAYLPAADRTASTELAIERPHAR